jgi:hypothetical protein
MQGGDQRAVAADSRAGRRDQRRMVAVAADVVALLVAGVFALETDAGHCFLVGAGLRKGPSDAFVQLSDELDLRSAPATCS